LSKYIEQGDGPAAARLASDLALKGLRLKAHSINKTQDEKEFMYAQKNKFVFEFIFKINRIYVQIDGNEYGTDQHGARYPIDVFQSTTVRELRAVVCNN
jgi:hypothetical protein